MARIIIGLLFLGLTACVTATGTAYGPADGGRYGYSETRIEKDRYRISFAGDGATSPDTVEAFALRRAAELALANGYDWFRVVGSDLAVEERGGVGLGAGVGSGRVGRRGGVGVGVGGDLGTIGARRFFTARIQVLMGNGEKPAGDPSAFDAQSVLDAGDAFVAPRGPIEQVGASDAASGDVAPSDATPAEAEPLDGASETKTDDASGNGA
ncbi:MAG: hypothetical protein AAF224_10565 [Pseudomonadota bacterium]